MADTAIPEGFTAPVMMAIGDSLFNGTRSLTTGGTRATPHGGTLAELSAPAIVARLVEADGFRVPDYPREILYDLEAFWSRIGLDVGRMQREFLDLCLANADAWLRAKRWSKQVMFDNLGIAGATYATLHQVTAGTSLALARAAFDGLRRARTITPDLFALYFNLNAAFLLNPGRDKALDGLTALEQVRLRKPCRLLVSIGSNDGLVDVIFSGNVAAAGAALDVIPAQADRLARFLAERCPATRHVYFNLLVRPRAVANLAPGDDGVLFDAGKRRSDGYFDDYVAVNLRTGSILRRDLREFDRKIKGINDETRRVVTARLGDRVSFVDLYGWSARYDRKHGTEKSPLFVTRKKRTRRLSNYPIHVHTSGLFGLDNLHPTTPGYALMAREMAGAILKKEGARGGAPRPAGTCLPVGRHIKLPEEAELLQWAFDRDTLLQNPPGGQHLSRLLLSFAGLALGSMFSAAPGR